jgi:hypothetical protein
MRQFDLTAYGYTGPARPETPKPGPPTAQADEGPTLTITLADLLDDETVARLRAATQPPATEPEPTAAIAQEPVVEPEVAAEPVASAEPPAADPWAALTSGLTQPHPDPWAAAVARFTHSTSAASSATQAA